MVASIAYQYQAVLLTNKDSAPAKDWVVDIGFKPDVIRATILSSTTAAADTFIKVNGGGATEDEEVIHFPAHQGGTGANSKASAQLDNALSFTDRGFRIERSTSFFRANDRQMLFECFLSGGGGMLEADLEDADYAEKIEPSYGEGSQYEYEDGQEDQLGWIVRET